MDITFSIEDSNVAGFSEEAKNRITSACHDYVNGIIAEAKRIEQSDRIGSAQVEVIASHVDEARKNYRRAPTRSVGSITLDIVVEILLLLLGALFEKDTLLENNVYLIVYVVILFISVVLLIIKYSKGA